MIPTNLRRSFDAPAFCAFFLVIAILPALARGGLIGLTVDLNFNSNGNTADYSVDLSNLATPTNWNPQDGSYTWEFSPTDPVNVCSGGNVLAKIKYLKVQVYDDPQVLLNFAVQASSSETHITVSSVAVSFAPLTNPTAFANAGVSVTDGDIVPDGATLTGTFPGSKAYDAQYFNGASFVSFADLVSPVSVPPGDTTTVADRYPASGSVVIPATVSQIRSTFDFNLSANDSASGTSRFNVTASVPEPSGIVLACLGLVALASFARRSRNICRGVAARSPV